MDRLLHTGSVEKRGRFCVARAEEVRAHGGAFRRGPEAGAAVQKALVAAAVVVVEAEPGAGGRLAEARAQPFGLGCAQPRLLDEEQRALGERHAVQAGVERGRSVREQEVRDGAVLRPHRGVAKLHVAAGRLAAAPAEKGREHGGGVVRERGPARDPRRVAGLGVRVGVGDDAQRPLAPEATQPAALCAPASGGEAVHHEVPQRLWPHGLIGVGARHEGRHARTVAQRDPR